MKMLALFGLLNVLVACFVGGVSAKEPGEIRKIAQKVSEYAGKNGYVATTSSYRDDKYQGSKNFENSKTQQFIELIYDATMPLQVNCHGCFVKNIQPMDLAKCRAEFMKVYEKVYGKRPTIEIPYVLTPAEDITEKKLGVDQMIIVRVKPRKCTPSSEEPAPPPNADGSPAVAEKTGYTFSIVDMKSSGF